MKLPVTTAIIALAACIAMNPAQAQMQTQSEAADLARYQQYAGPPLDSIPYFRIDGFQYLADGRIALWTGVNRMYLFALETPCIGLDTTRALRLDTATHTINARFDYIGFRNGFQSQRCRILQIRPVDELAMKRDARKAKAAPAARAPQPSGGT